MACRLPVRGPHMLSFPPPDTLLTLLRDHPLPAAVVDLDAFDHNVGLFCRALPDSITLRIATKSIRVPALIQRAQRIGGSRIRGLMTFSAAECALLADCGFQDLLLAYPVSTPHDARILARLAADSVELRVTVDHADQLPMLSHAAEEASTHINICMDVDMSTRLPGIGHVGVRRSPIQTVTHAVDLAHHIARTPGLHLDSILGYEAQVAGLADHNPRNQPWMDPIRRRIKALATPTLQQRRQQVVQGVRDAGFPVTIVNGGGSGSLFSTIRDPSITEITVGSGFMDSTLFDHYDRLPLKPALYVVLPVTRHPAPGFITCHGGGFIASGPPAADRTPSVVYPAGLAPLEREGWGEVQTPFSVAASHPTPAIGDLVWCRPAKAGEPLERFDACTLISASEPPERVPTYRGLSSVFT